MSSGETSDIFICSFCDQVIRITKEHIGRRVSCPKCARNIVLFPNRSEIIDRQLASTWYYQRSRLLLRAEEVGPISDEQFVELASSGEIEGDIEVRSPEITKDEWVAAGRVNVAGIKNRIEQRRAEQQRRSRKAERQLELAAQNMHLLSRGISAAIADGNVSVAERSQLLAFARLARISEAEVESLLGEGSRRLLQVVVEEALDDGILEPHEKQSIHQLATGLGIPLALTPEQLRRLELCELAWQLAAGTFSPDAISTGDVSLTANELPLARSRIEWLDVVQQRRPVGVPLGDGHFLKLVGSGECVLTNKRAILVGQFTPKKCLSRPLSE